MGDENVDMDEKRVASTMMIALAFMSMGSETDYSEEKIFDRTTRQSDLIIRVWQGRALLAGQYIYLKSQASDKH
jgi:hypothetical protein